jgi:hypothetical protein
MPQVARTGAVAILRRRTPDALEVHPQFFADLDDGRRINTDLSRHGGVVVAVPRNDVYRRYYGPEPAVPEEYRAGATDVVDAIRETAGLLSWREYVSTWAAWWNFVFFGGVQQTRDRRKRRWAALRRALDEAGVPTSRAELDRVPFEIEIGDELRRELGPTDA